MGNKFRQICLVETRRLLLVVGMMLAVVFMIQYFQQPYGNVISSLFSTSNARIPVLGSVPTGKPSQNSSMLYNLTVFYGLNTTNITAAHKIDNTTDISEGKGLGFRDDFILEKSVGSENLHQLDEDSDSEDESSSEDFLYQNHNSVDVKIKRNDSLEAEKAGASKYDISTQNVSTDNSSLFDIVGKEHSASTSENNGSSVATPATLSSAVPPISSLPPLNSPRHADRHSRATVISVNPNISSMDKDASNTFQNNEKNLPLQSDVSPPDNNSFMANIPAVKNRSKMRMPAVVSIPEMNDMLIQSRASFRSMKPRWPSAIDQELLITKSQIENAPIIRNDPALYAPLYRNVSVFKRSYELMEETLKVYIYREGERPIFHQPLLEGIYASEGWFMKLLEADKHFVTKNPRKSHLFYLPFSSRLLEVALYVPNSHNRTALIQCLRNYLGIIASRYSFWNRTDGADHFLVACHDWAPAETKLLMANCIRALCVADIKLGFQFDKDVSLPETNIRFPRNPLTELGGKPPSKRRILAFFAGNMHGYLRPILLQYWENKDPDMKIFGRLHKVKGQMSYAQHMKSSKYCICAKGYEVNSPRVVEAIFYECVPVIISDNYVPPFFEILNWESFAVFVPEKDIPNLKNVLLSIPKKRYLEMHRRVKQVQQHFLWHPKPVKYDIFHMILHSIWYTRVFQMRP